MCCKKAIRLKTVRIFWFDKFNSNTFAVKLPEFQCRVLGDDPVAEPRGAAGSRSNIIISVRRERPSSIVRPQPESCPFCFGVVSLGPVYGWAPIVATDVGQQPQRRPGGASGSVCAGRRPPHARAGNASNKVNAGGSRIR